MSKYFHDFSFLTITNKTACNRPLFPNRKFNTPYYDVMQHITFSSFPYTLYSNYLGRFVSPIRLADESRLIVPPL